ncbi:hypothetical protein [Candidatus Binatus soli]|jgi:hypothetical protein|uniref:hypothetical protein n=1 Tax=Candidatus Binatus soli TaxID=1953413 RepID=UPI003D1460BC
MKQRGSRNAFEQALIVAAAMTAAIICGLSYLADRPWSGKAASSSEIDLLAGNLTGQWSVYGALSATQVSFNRISDGSVEVKIHADDPSWSTVDSGVSYTAGLFFPGWYEFTGEFQAEVDNSEGIGAQLEVHSSRWRFITKAHSRRKGRGEKINVYFRPAYSDPAAKISCQFWGGTGDSAGKAVFRNMRIVRIAGAPPAKAFYVDLAVQEEARLGKSWRPHKGRNALGWWMRLDRFRGAGVAVLLLGMIVGISWRLLA